VPYGLTAEEYEAAIDADDRERLPRPNWADARDVVCEIARQASVAPNRNTIGRIRQIGDGLSNVVFGGTVRLHEGREIELVIKLPAPHARSDRDERLRVEAALLQHLNAQRLTFAVPRPIGEVETGAGLAVVQEWVEGFPVDLRAQRFRGGKPWDFVAEVAAGIHAINPAPIRNHIPSHFTRLDHAVFRARALQKLEEAEARDSEAWIGDHLPPNTPASLLHGDLLGQNLRRPLDDTGRVGVIDWAEACVGDPAYDLAIVTRGHRRPFAVVGGLSRLVDSYNRLAGSPVTVADVRVHELILHAGFYRAAIHDYGRGSPHAEQQRVIWRSLLRRVVQASE
jgi:aminoglycoside phosphotransferase (APT) family kinase protein